MNNNPEYLILAEIDDPTFTRRFFNYYAFTHIIQLDNDYTGLISSEFDPEAIGYSTVVSINSISVLNVALLQVYTLADVIATTGSWYHNNTNNVLYVHFPHDNAPMNYADGDIKINLVYGIYKTNSTFDGSINGQQYYPRLSSTGRITSSKDNLYYGKQKMSSNSIEIDNQDFRFVNYNIGVDVTQKKFGGLVKLKVFTGSDIDNIDYVNDFTTIYQGKISKIIESDKIKLDLEDLRKQYNKTSPNTTFDLVGNLYGESGLSEDPIVPQVWGKCHDVPTICLNKEGDSSILTDYVFLVCSNHRNLPANAIDKVYIDGVLQTSLSSGGSDYLTLTEVANGYIVTIDKYYFSFVDEDPSSGNITFQNMENLTLDMTGYTFGDGYDYTKGLYIMNAILNDNYDIDIDNVYYDDPIELATQADASYQIGYYLKEPKEVYKQLEDISASLMGYFVITPELKLKWQTDDSEPSKVIIPISQQLGANYIPSISQDPSEVLASIRVGYLKKFHKDTYEYITDDTNATDAVLNFNSRKSKDFETLITLDTDIADYISRLKVYTDKSNDTIKMKTLLNEDTALLQTGDYIESYVELPNKQLLGQTIQQIQSITINYEDMTIDITGRLMEVLGYYEYLADENGNFILDENDNYIIL